MKCRNRRFEAFLSSIVCVCMMLSIVASCAFALDEENADPPAQNVEEPVAEEPVVEEPVVEEVVVEEPVVEEVVVEEPVIEEVVVEEPVVEEPVVEEPVIEEPVAEETAGEEFDLEKAYEHYLSLPDEEQQKAYLDSLTEDQRDALKRYIEEKEEPEVTEETEEPEITEETEETEEPEETEKTEETEEPEETTEETGNTEGTEEPEEEFNFNFESDYISGCWSLDYGRDTSTVRNLTILTYIDGILTDTCFTTANRTIADFMVISGDCKITGVTSDNTGLTGSGTLWSVDAYDANDVTVSVYLESSAAQNNSEATTADLPEENMTAPSFEITIPVTTINMSTQSRSAELTIDARCMNLNGSHLNITCHSDHDFHFVYGEGKDTVEYGLYAAEDGERIGNGSAVATFTGDASASVYLKVSGGAEARFAGQYKDTITFYVTMVSEESESAVS